MKNYYYSEFGVLKNSDSEYLYRGLRKEEIDAGIKLIPKGIQAFEDLKLYRTNTSGLIEPIYLSPILAVLNHIQGFPTSGVSTSTLIGVAMKYALCNGGYIAVINREKIKVFGIREIIVKVILPLQLISKPEDEEVILLSDSGFFPDEIIEKVYKITEQNLKRVAPDRMVRMDLLNGSECGQELYNKLVK